MGTQPRPGFTVDFAESDDAYARERAADFVTEHAPASYTLPEITAHLGVEHHDLWLDDTTGLLWHSWQTNPQDNDSPWRLDTETPGVALTWIEEQCAWPLERLANPDAHYRDTGPGTAFEDLDLLDEITDVRLTGVLKPWSSGPEPRPIEGPDAAAADAELRRQIMNLQAQRRRLVATRAEHIRRLVGQSKNLNKAAVGRTLGITGETIGQYLADETRWRDQIIERAERSRNDPSV